MPIESLCQTCGNRLRVADEHAGKLARCPKCQTVYTVPTPAGMGLASSAGFAHGSGTAADLWRLKTSDGMIYGPVSRADLDNWLAEGRVTAQSQVLREGGDQWQWATQVYPQLASGSPGGSNSPFGGNARTAAAPIATAAPSLAVAPYNPYAAPSAAAYHVAPNLRPDGRPYQGHQGVVVLVLGLLSLMLCPIFAFPALILGFVDLRGINAGQTDPSGKSMTIIGMVLAGIPLVLMALYLVIVLVAIVASL